MRLKDKYGKSAGNIDLVVARYDKFGQIVDFGAVEIQAVYISGNIRTPFAVYMHDHANSQSFDWRGKPSYPRPDYLSSSRKRLAPQLVFKSGILHQWGKKTAVVLDRSFFNTLPNLDQVDPAIAEIAWMIYDLKRNDTKKAYELKSDEAVYTKFSVALEKITRSDAGDLEDFIDHLQSKFTKKFNNGIIASDSSVEDSIEEIE